MPIIPNSFVLSIVEGAVSLIPLTTELLANDEYSYIQYHRVTSSQTLSFKYIDPSPIKRNGLPQRKDKIVDVSFSLAQFPALNIQPGLICTIFTRVKKLNYMTTWLEPCSRTDRQAGIISTIFARSLLSVLGIYNPCSHRYSSAYYSNMPNAMPTANGLEYRHNSLLKNLNGIASGLRNCVPLLSENNLIAYIPKGKSKLKFDNRYDRYLLDLDFVEKEIVSGDISGAYQNRLSPPVGENETKKLRPLWFNNADFLSQPKASLHMIDVVMLMPDGSSHNKTLVIPLISKSVASHISPFIQRMRYHESCPNGMMEAVADNETVKFNKIRNLCGRNNISPEDVQTIIPNFEYLYVFERREYLVTTQRRRDYELSLSETPVTDVNEVPISRDFKANEYVLKEQPRPWGSRYIDRFSNKRNYINRKANLIEEIAKNGAAKALISNPIKGEEEFFHAIKAKERLQQKIAAIKQEIRNISTVRQSSNNMIKAHGASILHFEKSIQSLKEAIAKETRAINSWDIKEKEYLSEIENTQKAAETIKIVETETIKKALSESTANILRILNNFANNNIAIVDIEIASIEAPHSTTNDLSMLFHENYEIRNILLETFVPTRMKPTIPEHPERAAGPWYIYISMGQDRYSLPYMKMIYKYDRSVSHKVHPHAPAITNPNIPLQFSYSDFNGISANCLGELTSILTSAIKSKDFSLLLASVHSYLKTINVNDTWGRSNGMFPKASEVNAIV